MTKFEKSLKAAEEAYLVYANAHSNFNTDIIICKDGRVFTERYSGSVIREDEEIEAIFTIAGGDALDFWREMLPSSEEAQKELNKRGWFSVWDDAERKKPSEWTERDRFEPMNADLDFLYDQLEEIIENS